MTPDELPFEYPFRWQNEDLAKMAGVTPEAAAILEQRDRDLEDYLASLDIGIDEAFAADSAGTSTTTITSLNSGTPAFRVFSTNLGRFRTSGVSDLSAASTSVTLPAGLWSLTAQIAVTPVSSLPASGYVDVQFDYINEWVRVPWSQIVDPGSTDELAHAWLHRMYYFSTASTIGFVVDNFTDQSIGATCRLFQGVQLTKHGNLNLA